MADYKPADLHVSVVDLFSILAPGALLAGGCVVAWGSKQPPSFGPLLDTPGAQWVAFALASYALGHFLFLIGARLDYPLYDWYRRTRWPREADDAYSTATRLRHLYFGRDGAGLDDNAPLNTYAWAKALLVIAAPASAAIIDRYEADSKFFRSMVIALPALAVLLASRGWWLLLPLAALLSGLAFLLYAERRHKSTQWAYQFAIVLMRERVTMGRQAASPSAD